MNYRETGLKFLSMCALDSPKKAFELYVHPHFIHHNAYFPGDRDSLMNAMIDADRTHPNRSFTVKQAFEAADRVAFYSHVVKDEMEIAVLHILRFEGEKIAEMWDMGMVIDPKSPNQHGMF